MLSIIALESLKVKNFKGIKDLQIDFGQVTNVSGENGLGKTTIQDAFTFLLFDKDSKDITKFDVQPLDKDNNPIHNLETVIEAVLNVDGREVVLKRLYKEKYSKVRGTARTEFKGYESKYYVNEVPKKVTEYKAFINELLNEKLFKLITNPMYFSSLAWKDRRAIITEIVGDLNYKDVISHNRNLKPLEAYLNNNTVDDFVKANKAKINQLKKDRDKIPTRIDETNNSIQKFDFDGLELQRKGVISGIKSIDEKIADKSKVNEDLYKLKDELMKKKHELSNMEYALKANTDKPKQELQSSIRKIESDIRFLKNDIARLEAEKEREQSYLDNVLKIQIKDLRKDYKDIKTSEFEFDEEECKCPMCNRAYDLEDVEKEKTKAQESFNLDKANKIKRNTNEGKTIKSEMEMTEQKIKDVDKKIENKSTLLASTEKSLEALQEKLNNFNLAEVTETKEIIAIKKDISKLIVQINEFKIEDVTELKAKKSELQAQLRELDKQLAYKEINENAEARIAELTEEEARLSEKIAELEGLEILSEEFIRTKVELLEEKVNSKFKYVKFKMFKNQINGGIEECAEPCYNGIPYASNLNNAAKINCGIDIINTLCRHYNVNAPIFVDNAESVNELIESESQIIRLIVSKDKELKIERGDK